MKLFMQDATVEKRAEVYKNANADVKMSHTEIIGKAISDGINRNVRQHS